MRLLNSFKSQNHTRATLHVVSCLNNDIHLLLKAGKSKTNVLKSFKTTPLVWDSRASFGLTPHYAYFIDYVDCDIDVKDISKTNEVIGIGTRLHKFTATNGDLLYDVAAFSYHLPSADIRIFHPQAYH